MPAVLFRQPPVIRFAPEIDVCPCGGRLMVKKTRQKSVFSLTGPFIAHETVAECPLCSKSFVSEALSQLVQNRCNVAYDVLVFVGQALFQRFRTIEEVRIELAARNVRISVSEISYLGRKFITYLSRAHRQATPRILQAMTLSGGYVLHLDATHDGDAPVLMTGMDGLSQIVLANVKLASEDSEDIARFLQSIKATYGIPRACVHDMGLGIRKAVAEVFPGIPDFVCHFHFLRDIGKDFLDPAYRELRRLLRKHCASTKLCALVREAREELEHQDAQCALVAQTLKSGESHALEPATTVYLVALWALQGKHEGDGYGFPFDRPLLQFAQRIMELHLLLLDLLKRCADNRLLSRLAKLVALIANDSQIRLLVEELNWRVTIFDELRTAMRLAPVGGTQGLNDGTTAMAGIRQGVEEFRQLLDNNPRKAVDPLCRKMAQQIDKYGEKLFAGPIAVDTPNGTISIFPQRTNNILEQFFRSLRRWARRKTGNDSLCRILQAILADTPLVKNLDNPRYMEILLNGKASLNELFAEIASSPKSTSATSESEPNTILPGFRKLIGLKNLPARILHSLSSPSVVNSN